MMPAERKLDYIDALRGYAILGVMLLHCTHVLAPTQVALQVLSRSGIRGVQLFYVVSAFTLCLSLHSRSVRERHALRNFFIRRFFRIAPMFYVAILGYLLLYGFSARDWAPNGLRWWFVPLTALFLHGIHPETINSVVPGGWSVAVEMNFYLLLPFLMRLIRGTKSAVVFFFFAIALGVGLTRAIDHFLIPRYPAEQHWVIRGFEFLNFGSQLPVFVAGIAAYFATREFSPKRLVVAAAALGSLLAGVSVCTPSPMKVLGNHIVAGMGFALLVTVLHFHPFRAIVHKPIILIGKLSFSLYLLHFAVMEGFRRVGLQDRLQGRPGSWALFFVAVLATTLVLATLTYAMIEQPGIRAGKRWIERLEGADRPDANKLQKA
jgi:peptidoglycan/LPS O-acetylase OafA/YrhL